MLLDEPFGALDPVTRLDLQNRFLAIRAQEQVTSIFVTHDIREALKVGNLIALLNQGSLEFFGTPDEFRRGTGEETKRFLEVLE